MTGTAAVSHGGNLKCGDVNNSEYAAMKSGKRSFMGFEVFVKNTNKIDIIMSKTLVDELDIVLAKVDSLLGLTNSVRIRKKVILLLKKWHKTE